MVTLAPTDVVRLPAGAVRAAHTRITATGQPAMRGGLTAPAHPDRPAGAAGPVPAHLVRADRLRRRGLGQGQQPRQARDFRRDRRHPHGLGPVLTMLPAGAAAPSAWRGCRAAPRVVAGERRAAWPRPDWGA
ncbi:hypothetical protein [Frankia sp. AgKG'84/4]